MTDTSLKFALTPEFKRLILLELREEIENKRARQQEECQRIHIEREKLKVKTEIAHRLNATYLIPEYEAELFHLDKRLRDLHEWRYLHDSWLAELDKIEADERWPVNIALSILKRRAGLPNPEEPTFGPCAQAAANQATVEGDNSL